MADFSIAPYTGAQYIYNGLNSAGNAVAQAAADNQRANLGYFTANLTDQRDRDLLAERMAEMKDASGARNQAREDAIAERANESASKYDPQRVQPVPLKDADGNVIPNMFGIPMSGQILDMRSQGGGGVPMGSDPTGTGNFFYDGKTLKPVPQAQSRLPAPAAQAIDMHLGTMSANAAAMADNQQQIAAHQDAIAKGDTWTGLFQPRDKQIQLLQQKNKTLQAESDAAQSSIQQIKKAYQGTAPAPAAPGAAPAGAPAAQPGLSAAAIANPPSFMGVPLGSQGAPAAQPTQPPGAPPMPSGPGGTLPNNPLLSPVTPAGAAPAGAPKPLDANTAAQFMQQAGGDKNKARQMARDAGYTF